MNEHFAHLHLHTDASIRDGMGTVPNMISRAKALGFKQIAMTDHGTLANAITFSIEALSVGIKPLMGLEGYIAVDGQLGHITLLADGMRGWNSLLTLNNLAHESKYKQPAFDVDQLIKYNAGLVCLTGCVASPFHRLSFKEAQLMGMKLKGAFGHRLFAELMFVGDGANWERPMRLADVLGLNCVITNDVHFSHKTDAVVHPILTRMKSGFEYDSKELYLKSAPELVDAAVAYGLEEKEATDMIFRAGRIASKLGYIELHEEPHLPKVALTIIDEYDLEVSSGRAVIQSACGARERRDLLSHYDYETRFRMEMDVIDDMGYTDYFLILDDIIQQAKHAGVRVGPGRGSGAGSLVLYLLGITDVDPIKHGLQFERFLNIERKGMPDVDVDIDSENREKVLEYANKMYGAIPIATYSRYSHKSLVRDLGKMFRVDKDLIGRAAEGGQSSAEFIEIMEEHQPEFPHAYESFLGQMRHKGKHAGGVIITETPVPIERISDGLAAAWTEGKRNELSHAGIVKFDLLGLSVLSALRRLEEELDCIPKECVDDSPVFQLFRDGDLSGIFQFSGSDGIRRLTMELRPEKFQDLVAINALYRPGAIDAGSTHKYPDWKSSPREVPEYIADILEETYGAIVYQEQVMSIYQRTVGGTLAQADEARRVITKAKPDDPTWRDKVTSLEGRFLKGAIDNELTRKEANTLWSELMTHSRYSFNKSHSTAYAMIAWECAWWKYNYPTHFFAAMLNVDPAQEQTYIMDAVRSGIIIRPPHVNKSSNEWEADDFAKRISMPLSAIKFLGKSGVDALLENRKAIGGQFDSIEQFMEVVPKKFVRARAREGLLRLGGFHGLDVTYPSGLSKFGYFKKLLGLKELEPMTGRRDRQLKYLGIIIPTRRMLEKFEKYSFEGYTCGIINSKDMRESTWGPYAVYRLSPQGVFWSRDVKDLEKGEVVAAKISKKNGKAKSIKLI